MKLTIEAYLVIDDRLIREVGEDVYVDEVRRRLTNNINRTDAAVEFLLALFDIPAMAYDSRITTEEPVS